MPSWRGGCQKRVEEAVNGNATVSEVTITNCVCTGAGLSRGDAEFLARYAADAARTREALDQCVRQYDEVRRALER